METDWERLKELLDEFGIKYMVEPGREGCFRVFVSMEYLEDPSFLGTRRLGVDVVLDFHQGGRYER